MNNNFLNILNQGRAAGKKLMAILIDPDTPSDSELAHSVEEANQAGVDFFLVGGSLLTKDALDSCLKRIGQLSDIPRIIFPGSVMQVSPHAEGILFLSLISGRNPDLLIGNQVIAAPYIHQAGIEPIPTGYMIIDSGQPTTASYMSNSMPIPHNKPEIAACTALAGQYLGLQVIYMDGGSGALQTIDPKMVAQVRQSVSLPIIVGGGIRNPDRARELWDAGADLVVVGNAFESQPELIREIASAAQFQH